MSIELGRYTVDVTDLLGQGMFGSVYKGKDNKKKDVVAVKQVKLPEDDGGQTAGDATKEIKSLMKLPSHPNIVKFLDFHFLKNSFWMVMEYCNYGDLDKYFKKNKPVAMPTKVYFMRQMASAIAHMHALDDPIVHRDLKPANIMLHYHPTDGPVIKLTDFGLAKVAEDKIGDVATYLLTSMCGTPGFMAPEFFAQEKYSSSVDVFAMGLIFMAMLNYDTKNPQMIPIPVKPKVAIMETIGKMMMMSLQGAGPPVVCVEVLSSDDKVTKDVKELILKMVEPKPRQRPKASEVDKTLDKIFDSIKTDLPPPPAPPAGAAAMSSTHSDTSSEGSSGDDIGYMLLKQVMEEAMKERLKKQRDEPAREQLEMLGRGVPLLELLLKQAIQGEGTESDDEDNKFKTGERVLVDRCNGDIEKAKELQENYGGWVDSMEEYLGQEGTVTCNVLHVVKVKHDDGNSWSYNPALLLKVGGDGVVIPPSARRKMPAYVSVIQGLFKRFDVVQIPEEEEILKLLQEGHGGWNPKMKGSLGVKGMVNRVDKDGDVVVEMISKDTWVINPEALIKVDTSQLSAEPGDFVLIKDNLEEVKTLQEGYGGWNERMKDCLGHSGMVKGMTGNGTRAVVEVPHRKWVFNVKALIVVAKAEELMQAMFRKMLA